METEPRSISGKARKEKRYRFTNLIYLVNAENLQSSFYRLKAGKSSDIDGVSMVVYERNLDTNIQELVECMKRHAYKLQAVRRTYIQKANGKLRPLRIPTVENKIVQMCVIRILEAIFEVNFIGISYGFHRERNCHQALAALRNVITVKPVSCMIDADIKRFFDNVDHNWMMEYLKQRIADESLLRLIKRFLIIRYNHFQSMVLLKIWLRP